MLGGAPFGPRGEEPRDTRATAGAWRHEGGEPLQQERRGPVAPWPSEAVEQLPARALRQPLRGQGRAQDVSAHTLVQVAQRLELSLRTELHASTCFDFKTHDGP
jgi:hypothetical protein